MEKDPDNLIFAALDGDPVVIAKDGEGLTEAAVIYNRGQWKELHPADANKAKTLSEAEFDQIFGYLAGDTQARLTLPTGFGHDTKGNR